MSNKFRRIGWFPVELLTTNGTVVHTWDYVEIWGRTGKYGIPEFKTIKELFWESDTVADLLGVRVRFPNISGTNLPDNRVFTFTPNPIAIDVHSTVEVRINKPEYSHI